MSRLVSAQAKWRRIIKQQQSSGLTVTGFCRKQAVAESSFFAWKRRLRSQRQGPAAFVAIKTINDAGGDGSAVSSPSNGAIELCLPKDRRLILRRGFDHALLLEVLDLLENQA